jgi:hypothetical protein
MLFLAFYSVVSAALLFQGIQLLGSRGTTMGVVPPEVVPGSGALFTWGLILTLGGILLGLLGLLTLASDGLDTWLAPARNIGLALEGLYGLWLVFGRRIDYRPAPGAPTH